MSLVVKSINDALETQLLATLGSPWTELDYLFDLERNSFRQNTKRFGETGRGTLYFQLDCFVNLKLL